MRRNKWGAAAAALGLVTASVALGVAWQQYREARLRFTELRQLAGVSIFELDAAIQELPGSTAARKMVLDAGLSYLASLQAAAERDPGLRAELADAYQRVGFLYRSSSGVSVEDIDRSLELHRKALALRDELGQGRSRELKIRRDYAALLSMLAGGERIRMRTGKVAEYVKRLGEVVGPWAEEKPLTREALEAWIYWQDLETRQARREGTRPAFENQRRLLERVEELKGFGGEGPRYWKVLTDHARTFLALAGEMKELEECEAVAARMLEAARRWREAEPMKTAAVRGLLLSYQEGIYALLAAGGKKYGEYERWLEEYAAVMGSPVLPEPKAEYWVQHRVEWWSLKAHVAMGAGRRAEAEGYVAKATAELDRLVADGKPRMWAAIVRARMGELR